MPKVERNKHNTQKNTRLNVHTHTHTKAPMLSNIPLVGSIIRICQTCESTAGGKRSDSNEKSKWKEESLDSHAIGDACNVVAVAAAFSEKSTKLMSGGDES